MGCDSFHGGSEAERLSPGTWAAGPEGNSTHRAPLLELLEPLLLPFECHLPGTWQPHREHVSWLTPSCSARPPPYLRGGFARIDRVRVHSLIQAVK